MALPDFARVIHTYERVSTPLGRWLSNNNVMSWAHGCRPGLNSYILESWSTATTTPAKYPAQCLDGASRCQDG